MASAASYETSDELVKGSDLQRIERPDNVADQVYRKLRDAIASGVLEGGSRHSVYELAQSFGVSRTPVREAVLRLVDLDMISVERNRGIVIRGTDVEEIRSVFELRLLLEPTAASIAAMRRDSALIAQLRAGSAAMKAAAEKDDEQVFMARDREFHQAIISSLGNDRMTKIVNSLRGATQARGASTVHRSRDLVAIAREHDPILAAIVKGDESRARASMVKHLVETGSLLMIQVAAQTGEKVPEGWSEGFA
jgi:DNA-binding GntR family transcriptional regulator